MLDRSFFRWFKEPGHTWTIFGLGPTFGRRDELPVSTWTMGLNDTVRHEPVYLAHFIDYEALLRAIPLKARYVVMPWRPHVDSKPKGATLEDMVRQDNMLHALWQQERLYWYNLCTSPQTPHGDPDVDRLVQATYFSAEAAVSLLAHAGVKKIRLCGIDGGNRYSKEFDEKLMFRSGHTTFDLQWTGINRTAEQFGLDIKHWFGENDEGRTGTGQTASPETQDGRTH